MSPFSMLSPGLRAGIANWTLALIFLSVLVLIYDAMTRRSRKVILFTAAAALGLYLSLQCQILLIASNVGQQPLSRPAAVFGALPWAIPALVLAAITGADCALLRECVLWRRSNITLLSIKEGMDLLDTGLCYYWEDGIVKLANHRMESLCREITGGPLRNGAALWEAVSQAPIRELRDGSVWSFSRCALSLEGAPIYELTAAEITREYRLTEALREKEAALADYQRRLRAYGAAVDEVTAEGETLAYKIHIHDALSETLLTSRRYLEHPENPGEIRRLWLEAIQMGTESGTVRRDIVQSITDAGKAIGIRVVFRGEMPDTPEAEKLLTAGARTALTNAYRHAGASTLTITAHASPRAISYRNDGRPPEGPMPEGGGLSSLRQAVERQGGALRVTWSPEFEMTILLD